MRSLGSVGTPAPRASPLSVGKAPSLENNQNNASERHRCPVGEPQGESRESSHARHVGGRIAWGAKNGVPGAAGAPRPAPLAPLREPEGLVQSSSPAATPEREGPASPGLQVRGVREPRDGVLSARRPALWRRRGETCGLRGVSSLAREQAWSTSQRLQRPATPGVAFLAKPGEPRDGVPGAPRPVPLALFKRPVYLVGFPPCSFTPEKAALMAHMFRGRTVAAWRTAFPAFRTRPPWRRSGDLCSRTSAEGWRRMLGPIGSQLLRSRRCDPGKGVPGAPLPAPLAPLERPVRARARSVFLVHARA
ncbi:hypothetical protein ACSSS7_003295 [Eimeria intestinalis]